MPDEDPFPNLKGHPFIKLDESVCWLTPIKLEDGKMFLWYSICSMHRGFDNECSNCQYGSWVEVEAVKSTNDWEISDD